MKKKPKKLKRGNGEGGIYERPNKKGYYAQLTIGKKPDGRPAIKTVSAKTRAEVAAKLADLISKRDKGMVIQTRGHFFEDYARKWLERVKPTIRSNTYRNYRNELKYAQPYLGKMKLSAIKPGDIRTMLDHLVSAGKSPRTIAKTLERVRRVLNEALIDELIYRNPAAAVRYKNTNQDSEEIAKALNDTTVQAYVDKAQTCRYYPILYVIAALGLRRGEALGLALEDLYLKATPPYLMVTQQVILENDSIPTIAPLKTKNATRALALTVDVIEVIQAYLLKRQKWQHVAGSAWDEHGLVFCTSLGKPISPRNLDRSHKNIIAKAGTEDFRLHDLRHTFVTRQRQHNVPVEIAAKQAGHGRVGVTLDIYRKVYDQEILSYPVGLSGLKPDK